MSINATQHPLAADVLAETRPRDPIMTLRQFTGNVQRRAAREHTVSLAEVQSFHTSDSLIGQWWAYVEAAYNAGHDFTGPGYRTLDQMQARDLHRTSRALRQPARMA